MSLETTIDGIAEALVADIEAMGFSPSVKAYKWGAGPAGLDRVPAAVVQLPAFDRTGPDRPEDHLGALDLNLTFEVIFFFDRSNVTVTLPEALSVVASFVDAVDADPSLRGSAAEASVTHSEPMSVDSEGSSRPLFAYASTVTVEAYV